MEHLWNTKENLGKTRENLEEDDDDEEEEEEEEEEEQKKINN